MQTVDDLKNDILTVLDLYENHLGQSMMPRTALNSLFSSISMIGKKLGQHLSREELLSVAESAASANEEWYGRRLSLITRAWDGVRDKYGNIWVA